MLQSKTEANAVFKLSFLLSTYMADLMLMIVTKKIR